MHPYSEMPYSNFWKSAVAGQPVGLVDPMQNQPSFIIRKNDKVATMGSCFAQHVSKLIQDLDLNFLVTDSDLGAKQDGVGIFSARYGNVYTVRQALQLIETARDGEFLNYEIWQTEKGFVDSLRPNAIPGNFSAKDKVIEDREHLRIAINKMISEMDVFVYTLGLTEGWLSKLTGQVYPIAPGVLAGDFNTSLHESYNDNYTLIRGQLKKFLDIIRTKNANCKIILTVSPVPLAATHGSQHILAANIYSKSILRVVAQEICATFDEVYYFPSYEIIVGLAQPGNYFQPNLREIYPRGIDHAMRVFKKHFIDSTKIFAEQYPLKTEATIKLNSSTNETVQCDENLIYNLGESGSDEG
jgi:hypothetical protein